MFESSRLELSAQALRQNLRFIRSLLPEGCLLSSVVKGNAYGHGISHFIPLAVEEGIRHFSTYSTDEAYAVKQCAGFDSHIMIMGDVEVGALEWTITNGISFWVFDLGRLTDALRIAQRLKTPSMVHLEVETGMNRNGLNSDELTQALETIRNQPNYLRLMGICSHLAGAESISNHYRIERQRERFEDATQRVEACGYYHPARHLACSAAVVRYPETCMDLVRVGIMQYGFFPTRELLIEYTARHPEDFNPLQRVLTWKTNVMSIKHVKRGEFIGYGTSYQATDPMVIANIPVGYSHGYSRTLSNLGTVLVRGQRAPVVGVVNMNQISINVTHIEGVDRGDEVVLIGCQGEEEITVGSFSDVSSQVNYELLTRLPENIPRFVV